jgi:Domain of unknown function (DUF4234)
MGAVYAVGHDASPGGQLGRFSRSPPAFSPLSQLTVRRRSGRSSADARRSSWLLREISYPGSQRVQLRLRLPARTLAAIQGGTVSDTSGGAGWWQASDGKWYRPEQHPNYRPVPSSTLTASEGEYPLVAQSLPGQPASVVPSTVVQQPRTHDGLIGKTRNPWGVFLLSLIPFYSIVWYFKINRELRDLSDQIEVQPGMAVVAVTLGGVLIGIPPLVSWIRTCGRIQKAQKIAGATQRCSALVSIVCFWFAAVYMQSQLNKVWDKYGNPPENTPITFV